MLKVHGYSVSILRPINRIPCLGALYYTQRSRTPALTISRVARCCDLSTRYLTFLQVNPLADEKSERRVWSRARRVSLFFNRSKLVGKHTSLQCVFRLFDPPQRITMRDRLYAWWWWRSPNRPHIIDKTYIRLLDQLPSDALGLDLGSRSRVRESAITLDVMAVQGVDVVGDAHDLPFHDATFDYVWCNAVLEHVPYPMRVATEIGRTLKPGGLAFIQVPFLENVHGWPDDYFRFTLQGLRVLFSDLKEVASGVSAGPGQVLPDLVQYYCTLFAELQKGSLLVNLYCLIPGFLLLPVRLLDHLVKYRSAYWKWARAYYWVGRKPLPGETKASRPSTSVGTGPPGGSCRS